MNQNLRLNIAINVRTPYRNRARYSINEAPESSYSGNQMGLYGTDPNGSVISRRQENGRRGSKSKRGNKTDSRCLNMAARTFESSL